MTRILTDELVAFLSAALVTALLTPLLRRLALRRGLLDHALSARKVHGQPVPRLGGIAIVAGFYASLLALLAFGARSASLPGVQGPSLLVASLAIALLGVYDDLRGAGAGQKFLVQFSVAFFMYAVGFRIEALSNPFGAAIELGPLSLPLTLLWFVGITNAFNLIDGLDGLAGGVALIAIATNVIIAIGRGETTMVVVSLALAGAVLGFLFYNFNPASIFMGDTGSMFLGFVIATLSLAANQKSSTAVAILIPVTALGLPILDTSLAFFRRALRGDPVFHADREHIHHLLLARGLTHKQAVLSLYVLSSFLGAMALMLNGASSTQAASILGGSGVVVYLLLSQLGYLKLVAPRDEGGVQRSRAGEVLLLADKLRFCQEPEQVWEIVKALGHTMRADCLTLTLVTESADGETATCSFALGYGRQRLGLFRASFPLRSVRGVPGALELGWRHADQRIGRDEEEAIAHLCEEIRLSRGESAEAARRRRSG